MLKSALVLASVAALSIASPAPAAVNLVSNGNFEAGDTGFTSEYVSAPALNTTEGQYTVRADPFPWNPNFVSVADHTSGSGQLMMVANGSPTAGDIVWQSALIGITPATNYFFEAFVMNVCCNANYTGPNSAPILTFSISLDGGPPTVLNTLTIPVTPGIWNGLSTTFNSLGATTATLYLVNANTERGGNDFAVDDISLSTESIVNGVPEPSTWLMMLLGFGGIGFVMRRARPTGVPQPAA